MAPATGRVMRSIQLKVTSLNPLRAEKIKNVSSINNSPLNAPLRMPFCGVLMPIIVPMRMDRILIAIFTGIITPFPTDAKRMMMANTNTKPIAMRVENRVARRTSRTSCLIL